MAWVGTRFHNYIAYTIQTNIYIYTVPGSKSRDNYLFFKTTCTYTVLYAMQFSNKEFLLLNLKNPNI